MKTLKIAVSALALGALAMGGAAQAHPKHKHKHKHHSERVITRTYVVGQRLPSYYYSSPTYYVQPSMYQLPPAPYGYRYVRVGNAVYLAQTKDGMISQVITSLIR